MTACLTFAVSIVVHLDLGSSEAGISVKFTVVEVGLAITAAHGPLVRLALLKQMDGRMSVQPRKLEHTLTQPSCQVRWSMCASRAQGTPALVTIRDSTPHDTTGILLPQVLHVSPSILVHCQLASTQTPSCGRNS